MNHIDAVREATSTVWRGVASFDDLFDEVSDEDLARLWLAAEEWAKAANTMKRIVGDEWVSRDKSVTVDGFLVFSKKARTKETCIDSDGFLDWMVIESQEDTRLIHRLINPNSIRKGSLPPSVRDTFFEKESVALPESQPSAVSTDVLDQVKTKKELQDGS